MKGLGVLVRIIGLSCRELSPVYAETPTGLRITPSPGPGPGAETGAEPGAALHTRQPHSMRNNRRYCLEQFPGRWRKNMAAVLRSLPTCGVAGSGRTPWRGVK